MSGSREQAKGGKGLPSFHGKASGVGIGAALLPDVDISGSDRFSLVWI